MAKNKEIKRIIKEIDTDIKSRDFAPENAHPLPLKDKVIELTNEIIEFMFPEVYCENKKKKLGRTRLLGKIYKKMKKQINLAISSFDEENSASSKGESLEKIAIKILFEIPKIKSSLLLDADAIFRGDPAATSVMEVMLTYPGFYAISVYRLAGLFYRSKIPLIPRIMTEYAHKMTGIDIHPGALIREAFFIDHGTGVVIGQTAEIGKNVRIYQGVTLGAKSFETDREGNPIKGKKRHPTICDNCIIYAGATILGGDTIIGEGSIIGGNVWLTKSVPPHSKIYYKGS